MSPRHRWLPLMLLTVAGVSGCSQWYNGGIGMNDRKAVAEYQRFKQEQQAQLQQARATGTPPATPAAGGAAGSIGTPVTAQSDATVALRKRDPLTAANAAGGTAPPAPPVTDFSPTSAAPARAPEAHGVTPWASTPPPTATPPSPAPAPAPTTAQPVAFTNAPPQPPHQPRNPAAQFTNLQLYGDVPAPTPAATPPGAAAAPGASISPLDGGDSTARVTFTTEGSDFDPDLDRTGQFLVYASTRHRETSDLYLKRVDGVTVTQLTADPANDVMPAFSPDGRRVAFASDRGGNWDIYVLDVRGGQPVQVTNSPAHEVHPSWSPDGTQLVFCTLGGQSGQWEMVTMNVDKPGARRFIGYGLFPDWSPTGNRIVFQRPRERGTRWFSIWTVELDDTGEALRPTEIAAAANAACITPSWSPDGKHLTFATVMNPTHDTGKPTQADVWVVSADGASRANLTRSPFANLQPSWGPDGAVYFVSDRGQQGVENVWSLRPDYVVQMASPAPATTTPTAAVPTP